MGLSPEQNNHTFVLLSRICDMIAGRTPLAEILRAITAATEKLAAARWSLFLHVPQSRPAEFHGPDESLPLGSALLQALEQTPAADGSSAPLTLTVCAPSFSPTTATLVALTMPIYQGKVLRGALAAFYEHLPEDDTPAIVLALFSSQARLAIEKRRLDAILSESYPGTIRALASAIDARDPTTHRHSQAVTELAVALAEALNLNEEEVNTIRDAAILHDVGKIGISESILFKSGPLTPRERAVVEAHPLVGASILSGVSQLQELIPLILHHHERYDGTGYPDGLRFGDPGFPLGAQILAIADNFDAMTTERPYHRGLSISEACDILQQQAGKSFHPELIAVFIRMIRQRLLTADQV